MSEKNQEHHGLPENAFRPLRKGEDYNPIISSNDKVAEITFRSIFLGLIMVVIFSGAAAFLGLKIGQVFEAAIPIAIIAVGLTGVFKRKSTILENVIIQSIGSCSGVVVAGSIFTLPAIFILHLKTSFFEIATASFLGGCIGILMLILFRKYFVRDMHGQLPFPEATATTEILVSGKEGGKAAKVLLISLLIGACYDFTIYTLQWVNESFTTSLFHWGKTLADKTKLVFNMNITAAVMGMGYIIGLKYSSIICAGSFLSYYVFIPLVVHFYSLGSAGHHIAGGISDQSIQTIFSNYVRLIGIGGIAAAGLIGVVKSSKIIKDAIILGFKELIHSKYNLEVTVQRTDKDIQMKYVFYLIPVLLIASLLFFGFSPLSSFKHCWVMAIVAVALVGIISFLFTTVAARAIAIVGTNPVSGMTLMTLIITSIILIKCGLSGNAGIIAALIIGGVVSTALSMSGSFVTDLKIGYWIGATPANQERYKFLGSLLAAGTVGIVIILLNKTYGFHVDATHPEALVAPQANAMAAVIKALMSNTATPWTLYGTGVVVAIICEMCGVPPLAFALGMYLPLELTTPLLMGALVSYFIQKSSKNEVIASARAKRGTLISSGLIAGGSIVGVLGALIKYFHIDQHTVLKYIICSPDATLTKNVCDIFMYIGLVVFVYLYACITVKERKDDNL